MQTHVYTAIVRKYDEEVKKFEVEMVERHRGEMKEELQKKLESLDRELSSELVKEGGYESRGLVEQTILSSVGKVAIRVRRYRHRTGKWCYPLRDRGGIGRETQVARELCVRVAVERSYGASASLLKELRGIEISRMRTWKIVQEEGLKAALELEAMRRQIFEDGRTAQKEVEHPRPAIIQLDGTMIASREEGEKDQYGHKHMEAKVAVLFRGVSGQKRKKTVSRTVYAQVSDAENFGERWYTHCCKNGLEGKARVHLLGDGARWIRMIGRAMFPDHHYTLDLRHFKERAGQVLLDHQHKQFFLYVMAGLPKTALEYLNDLRPSDHRHAQALRDFENYVIENLDGIRYQPGTIHGSGVIEKMADIVVGRRLKRQGMIWSTKGANAILALRSRFLNTVFIQQTSPVALC
jgi:hypothetical protein